ncbi:polyphosphate:AMP phosphotransferase [Chitiniphilus shinanonensis]|uniref:Polyphosphate:AMP phosphotransferase n=1 Tax=Chitiniphilus shinanonensis TaxID=553088 RepID=A0ABQ6BTI5_9NEIS|nr:polyphosphate:AMP phosphotransferase [Chitiniphilus shinanonensis]GLS05325.1 polyphosphate:AMP phosphotransferase [Chitiniphilus shinanonensis]
MFESAELGHEIDKASYREEALRLREALLTAQLDLKQRGDFPVVIILAGVPAAGKGETANMLTEWMDPRHIATHAFGQANDEESARAPFWRFWRVLPEKGTIGIMFGGWYADPLWHWDDWDEPRLARRIERIVRLEKMLADEGALVLKFWLHLSRDKLRQRLKTLEGDTRTAWRVTREDKRFLKEYDQRIAQCRALLTRTNLADAPWRVIEGWDANYRDLSVARQVHDAIVHQLERENVSQNHVDAPPLVHSIDGVRLLDTLQLDHTLTKAKFKDRLELAQGRLNGLMREVAQRRIAVVAVFEGMDAAGKGGAIRRVTAALDARQYRVVPIAAPTDEEKAQPYLWRFWRHLPPHGRLAVFDRSWYGRVLVERIEGFATYAEWMRAYNEINDFEAQLVDAGTVVIKFWLAIDKDEQLRRFKEREATGYKRFKITDEDWRNRDKWDDYVEAASDMIERTNTPYAPWHQIGANNKYHARIAVLDALCDAIEQRLKQED